MIGEIPGGLAGSTAVNIVLDKVSHPSPPEGSREEFIGFEVTGVARAGHVMVEGNYIVTEFWVMGNIQTSLAEDGTIRDCPVFQKSFLEF